MAVLARAISRRLYSAAPSHAAKPATVLLSELFASVQGEGPFTGRPSIFARLGVCNLSCAWCDTPYTWLFTSERLQKVASRAGPAAQPKAYDRAEELTRVPVELLLDNVQTMAGSGIRSVVVTGGEPLLQKKPLRGFLDRLIEHGFAVEFETNGTVSPQGLPAEVHLNVSPKLTNSMQPREQRVKLDVLNECVAWPSSVLKFVVGEQEDLDEVRDIVSQLDVRPERVFLMPLGTVCLHLAMDLADVRKRTVSNSETKREERLVLSKFAYGYPSVLTPRVF